MPSITNLATTAALTTDENKIPKVSDLVKIADSDTETKGIKDKYITISDYNKLRNNILDAKNNSKKMVNESGLNEKIKRLSTKEEIMNKEIN